MSNSNSFIHPSRILHIHITNTLKVFRESGGSVSYAYSDKPNEYYWVMYNGITTATITLHYNPTNPDDSTITYENLPEDYECIVKVNRLSSPI
jgi:hypothetical protein